METILDICTQEHAQVRIRVEQMDGVVITTQDEPQESVIAWLMQDKGKPPMLFVYADPELGEASHKIDLSALFDN